MKRTEPLILGDIIDKMIQSTGLRPQYQKRSVEALWPRIVGKHIASYTIRTRLEGRTLHVYISSAPLKEELGYLKETLCSQLNEAAEESLVDNIIIH